jgi:hypothetical protein
MIKDVFLGTTLFGLMQFVEMLFTLLYLYYFSLMISDIKYFVAISSSGLIATNW